MQTSSQNQISFEYKPLQTEMGNYNQEASDISCNDNTIQYSQMKDQIDEEPDNCAFLNLKRQCDSFETLKSLRISRSVSGKVDNEKMLLRGMNNSNNDKEDIIQTPKKKPNNKIVIGALFDYSTTNNKNVMVSELDIQISSNNKMKAKLDERYQFSSYNTDSTENRKNLLKDFENKMQRLYPSNVIEKNKKTNINSSPYHENMTDVAIKTSFVTRTSKIQSKIPCNNKPINARNDSKKTKKSCSSKKTMPFKTAIYDILQRLNTKHIPSSSKSKNSGALSYLSTGYQETTISSKRFSSKQNPMPTERSKIKAEIPIVSSFRYNDGKIIQRPGSLKQKGSCITEFDRLTSKAIKESNSKKDCSLNYTITTNNNNKTNINKTIRTSTKSNSRSKSKKKNGKGAIGFNLNCPIFHTIQALTHQRIKNSLLHTISCKKNSTTAYFPLQNAILNKEKIIVPKQNFIKAPNKKKEIQSNCSYLNAESERTVNALPNDIFQSNKNKVHYQTPMNTKPHIQIYKNTIKHVMITPMAVLKMKLLNNNQKSIKPFSKKKNSGLGKGYYHLKTEN